MVDFPSHRNQDPSNRRVKVLGRIQGGKTLWVSWTEEDSKLPKDGGIPIRTTGTELAPKYAELREGHIAQTF